MLDTTWATRKWLALALALPRGGASGPLEVTQLFLELPVEGARTSQVKGPALLQQRGRSPFLRLALPQRPSQTFVATTPSLKGNHPTTIPGREASQSPLLGLELDRCGEGEVTSSSSLAYTWAQLPVPCLRPPPCQGAASPALGTDTSVGTKVFQVQLRTGFFGL